MYNVSLFFRENDFCIPRVCKIIAYKIGIRNIGVIERFKVKFMYAVSKAAGKHGNAENQAHDPVKQIIEHRDLLPDPVVNDAEICVNEQAEYRRAKHCLKNRALKNIQIHTRVSAAGGGEQINDQLVRGYVTKRILSPDCAEKRRASQHK